MDYEKKKEQKNDNKDSVCTREYELGQLERPFRLLETFSVAVEEITDCTYHKVFWR